MNKIIWAAWGLVSLAIALFYLRALLVDDYKSEFLIGDASHGHFQIEMACETCHTSPFGGDEVLQDACTNCHAKELKEAHDSHPKKKFTDPREAFRLEILDARYCVSCHTEHQHEQTRAMGVTLPDDYCYHCHLEVVKERESHKDLPFDSCASSGCHNFHDNRALYESFLLENSGQLWLKEVAKIAQSNATVHLIKPAISTETSHFSREINQYPDIANHWLASSHAKAGVDCGGCHNESEDETWIASPSLAQCEKCHQKESDTFTSGKHGMRLASALSMPLDPITPGASTKTFRTDSLETQHGCNACHSAHQFNPQNSAVESCLTCHADEHSLAYLDSPHALQWQKEKSGRADEGSGVTCATCHMPRIEDSQKKGTRFVNHNQNDNLRPNEKMIRPVCMQCHGLEFSIDALADPKLILNNFNGKPGIHIESVDWSIKRKQN